MYPSNFTPLPCSGSGEAYSETTSQIEVLLSVPLASLALRVLDIAAYATLMSYLPWDNWKEVAINLVKSVVNNPSKSQLSKVGNHDHISVQSYTSLFECLS